MNISQISDVINPKISFGWKKIDPAVASDILSKNKYNRPLMKKNLNHVINIMTNDEFINFHPSPIIVQTNKNGEITRLLDGQHRLEGIITTGKTYNLLLASYQDDKVFPYLDGAKPREVCDKINFTDNYKMNKKIQSIVKQKLDLLENNKDKKLLLSYEEIWENTGESIVWALDTFKKTKLIYQTAINLLGFADCYYENKEDAIKFADNFINKAELYRNHPVVELERFLQYTTSFHTTALPVMNAKYNSIITSFHFVNERKPMKKNFFKLKMSKDKIY